MKIGTAVATAEHDLLLVVERLATQDKRRIVQLVELLSRAPTDVRAASQKQLRQLLARESMTHAECQQSIESVLAGIVRGLNDRDVSLAGPDVLRPAPGRAASGG